MHLLVSLIDIVSAPLDAYRWLVATGLRLARDLFADYGYIVLFLSVCLENMLFLGLFVPGMLIILLAGISAYQGLIDWRIAFIVGLVGTSIGDTCSYLAGRYGWKRAIEHTAKVPYMDLIRSAMHRHTAWFVLVYHFMGYTRLVGPLMAGALRIPFLRWWLLDLAGATLWVGTYLALGMFFARLGFTLDDAESNVRRLEWVFAALAVAAIGFSIFMRSRGGSGPPAVLERLADADDEAAEPSGTTRRDSAGVGRGE